VGTRSSDQEKQHQQQPTPSPLSRNQEPPTPPGGHLPSPMDPHKRYHSGPITTASPMRCAIWASRWLTSQTWAYGGIRLRYHRSYGPFLPTWLYLPGRGNNSISLNRSCQVTQSANLFSLPPSWIALPSFRLHSIRIPTLSLGGFPAFPIVDLLTAAYLVVRS
jgi:hypothetical protein